MTIHSVDKMWSRDSSDFEVIEGNAVRVAIREAYQVVHSEDATPLEIQGADGIPAANSTYPGTSYVYAMRAAPTRVSPIMSIVEVAYEGESDADSPEIRYTDVGADMEIDEDFDGNPIVTDCGEFMEGVVAQFADPQLIVRRKFLEFDQFLTAAYRRATNSDFFNGWPPGTARLTQFDAELVGGEVTGHWMVTATITFRFPYRTTADKAWYARTLHQGYYENKPSNLFPTNIVRAKDAAGEPTVRPVLLKPGGVRETNPFNAYWKEWKLYDSLPYNSLGLL